MSDAYGRHVYRSAKANRSHAFNAEVAARTNGTDLLLMEAVL